MDTFILRPPIKPLLGFVFVNLLLDWHSQWKVSYVLLRLLLYSRGRISHFNREARQTLAVLCGPEGSHITCVIWMNPWVPALLCQWCVCHGGAWLGLIPALTTDWIYEVSSVQLCSSAHCTPVLLQFRAVLLAVNIWTRFLSNEDKDPFTAMMADAFEGCVWLTGYVKSSVFFCVCLCVFYILFCTFWICFCCLFYLDWL